MIYLDYAANTPVHEEVLRVFGEVSRAYIANPNAVHGPGRLAGERMDACTNQIKELLGAGAHELVYTSGSTEGNNLAIKGIAEKYQNRGKHIITTYLEHSSVNGPLAALQNRGFEIDYVDTGTDGRIDLNHLKTLLRQDTVLLSVCYVDSETGVTQDIAAIGELAAAYPSCFFHVDATQAVGKLPPAVLLPALGKADVYVFSPHKFFGLNGSGVLIKKEDLMLEVQMHGGVSSTPYRSGTPALGLAAAAEKALFLAMADAAAAYEHVEKLNRRLRAALTKYPKVKINSTAFSVPHILNISLPGVKTEPFRDELDKHGICVSTRSACCAPNSVSRPVFAVTRDRKRAMSPLRISLSHLTTESEADAFLKAFQACYDIFAG